MTEREKGVHKDGALSQDGWWSLPTPNRTRLERFGTLSTSRYWVGDEHSDIFLQRMTYVRENFLKEFQLKELAES